MTKPHSFFVQTYDELKKVQWPSSAQVIRLTVIVLIISSIVGAYIGALDYIFVLLTEFILE